MLSLKRFFPGILAWDSFFHLNHDDQRQMFLIFRAHAAPRAPSARILKLRRGFSVGGARGVGVDMRDPVIFCAIDSFVCPSPHWWEFFRN
jgi:hypothetical protein